MVPSFVNARATPRCAAPHLASMYRLNACNALWQDVGRQQDSPGHAQARHRQQELFVMVDAAVAARCAPTTSRSRKSSSRSTPTRPTRTASSSFSRAGKVPTLIDGDVTVLGLACDHRISRGEISRTQGCGLADRAARAHARAISAEMHSGFVPLRSECGMNLHQPIRAMALSEDAQGQCGAHPGDLGRVPRALRQAGPFLFGAFSGRGRDVRAGGASLPHLRDPGEGGGAALC